MTAVLLAWICTSAAMDDCQVWGYQSWENSPHAGSECLAAIPGQLAELRAQGHRFVVVRCLDEKDNEIKGVTL